MVYYRSNLKNAGSSKVTIIRFEESLVMVF